MRPGSQGLDYVCAYSTDLCKQKLGYTAETTLNIKG